MATQPTATRRLVDARTEPVTITTIPLAQSTVARIHPGTVAVAQPVAAAARPATSWRMKVRIAVAVAGLLAVAIGGFVFGFSEAGTNLLVAAAGVAVLAIITYGLLNLMPSGRGSAHCPGAWHR